MSEKLNPEKNSDSENIGGFNEDTANTRRIRKLTKSDILFIAVLDTAVLGSLVAYCAYDLLRDPNPRVDVNNDRYRLRPPVQLVPRRDSQINDMYDALSETPDAPSLDTYRGGAVRATIAEANGFPKLSNLDRQIHPNRYSKNGTPLPSTR